jgi:hypothetical protein
MNKTFFIGVKKLKAVYLKLLIFKYSLEQQVNFC